MLGIVLAPNGQVPGSFPYGVGYSYGGNGTFMCPEDPQHYRRGEAGHYYDTQLGLAPPTGLIPWWKYHRKAKKQLGSSIPGDLELQPTYGFAPHMTGWIATKQGFVQSPWNSPNGYRPSPLSGFGVVDPSTIANPDISAVLTAMNEQNSKMFTLSVITAVAVAVSAVVAIVKNAKSL